MIDIQPAEAFVIALLVAMAVGVVVWLGRRFAVRGPRRGRPSWLGPDPVQVESSVRSGLDELRWAAGSGTLRSDEGLDEMARHEAHRASVEGQLELDGAGLERLRRALYPELVGPLGGAASVAVADTEACVAALIRDLGPAWSGAEWTAGAVGVARNGGRLWACAVLARRLAVLDGSEQVHDGVVHGPDMRLAGVLAEGCGHSPRFALQGPRGRRRPVPNRARGERRFAVQIQMDTTGNHRLFLDDEEFFCWRFVEPEKQ